MDQKQQLAIAKGRVGRIKDQIASLVAKQRETEAALTTDHANVREAAGRRGHLVAQLIGASEGVAAKLHKEIDGLDTAIRVGERMAESRQKLLANTAQEIESLSNELVDAQSQFVALERAQNFEAWKVQVKQRIRSTAENVNAARSGLGELSILLERGTNEFGGVAVDFTEPLVTEFRTEQCNSMSFGWRPAGGALFAIMVHPMVRQ